MEDDIFSHIYAQVGQLLVGKSHELAIMRLRELLILGSWPGSSRSFFRFLAPAFELAIREAATALILILP